MCECGHQLSQHPDRGPCDYRGYSCSCSKYKEDRPKLFGFLIDSFDRSEEFRKALREEAIFFRQGPEDNVVYVRQGDKEYVVQLAESMEVEWQWTT